MEKVLDANSRVHYCATWQVKGGWGNSGRIILGSSKSSDPARLWKEAQNKLQTESDRAWLWLVSGGLGLTYRIDANGKPIGVSCRLVKDSFVLNLEGSGDGDGGKE